MKRILTLSAVAALALSLAAVALANGPAGHHHAARLGAPGSGGGKFTAWRDCLKQQGLPERPARGAKPSDADRAKLKAAFEACKSALPAPVKAAQDAFAKYRECLKQQGLPERPARGAKPSDADRAKLKAAFEACKSALPAPVKAAQDAFAKYRECLKQQGLPERPARGAKPSDADRAKLKAAFEACKSALPQRPHSFRSTVRHR